MIDLLRFTERWGPSNDDVQRLPQRAAHLVVAANAKGSLLEAATERHCGRSGSAIEHFGVATYCYIYIFIYIYIYIYIDTYIYRYIYIYIHPLVI